MKRQTKLFSILLIWLSALFFILLIPPGGLQAAGTITGNVFHDRDADGTDDDASEVGVAGVTVTIYDAAGANQGSATTNATGDYSIISGGTGPYRIEFTNLPPGYTSGPRGSNSETSVRFIPDGNSSNIDFGVFIPDEFCQNNPNIATNCFVPEAQAGTSRVIARLPYDSSGDQAASAFSLGTKASLGTVWGLAYQQSTQFVFSSAYMRRHANFGPGGPGQIYRSDAAGTVTPFITIPNAGTNPHPTSFNPTGALNCTTGTGSTYTVPHSSFNCYFHDPSSFEWPGRMSLGDLDIYQDPLNPNNDMLFVVNMFDRNLYRVSQLNTTPTVSAPFAMPLNLPGATGTCPAADVRPFALTIWRDTGYLGLVCSAATSQNRADLRAYIYSFNPNPVAFASTPLIEFPLNYGRGMANGAIMPANWQPWINNPALVTGAAYESYTGANYEHVYPQPMLSDIVFDREGNITVGLRDRFGDQGGSLYGRTDTTSWNTVDTIAVGDILKICLVGGVYQLESNGVCGGVTSAGNGTTAQGLPQGPGTPGNEFYYQDAFQPFGSGNVQYHEELATGGLAYHPSRHEVMTTIFDPLLDAYTGGARRFNVTNGTQTGAFQLYAGQAVTFSKSNGMGDVEILCDQAPVEVGNRVWRDNNNNGRQDPGEPAIAGVTVTLHNSAGTQIASAVTDANGNYYFSSASGTNLGHAIYGVALTPGSNYSVRINTTQAALVGLSPTLLDDTINASDLNDSDGDPSLNVGFVTAPFTVGRGGANNHSYDFGFAPATLTFSLGNRVWFDTDNDGQIDGSELGVDGVSVSLFLSSDTSTVIATTTTADGGYYRFDNLPTETYVVRVNPSNFTGAGVLASYTSSTPPSAAADDNDDNDDNGINNTDPASNGILSSPVILGPTANEPTDETDLSPSGQGSPDAQANMTVDFGFFRLSIGNQLWLDPNNNGILDGGEVGTLFAGVRVELYDGATLVAVTTTDATGAYLFDRQTDNAGVATGLGLAPSAAYTVRIPASEFATGEPLAPYTSSTGATSGTDSRDNGIDVPNPAASGISSAVFSLQPDSATGGASVNNATATTHNPTLDFGFYTLSLGNLVWYDTNNNGLVDGGETGINNVTVNLYRDTDNNGIPDGAAIATTTTNATGHYLFTGLTADTYIVEIMPPSGHISSTGTNVSATGPYEPAPDPNTVATDNDDNGTTSGGVIRSASVTLSVGGEPTGETPTTGITDPAPDNSSNLTVDFGLYQPLRLGNLVWLDLNNNGEADGGEIGISGVTVQLLDSTGTTVLGSTTTDASGLYLFDNLIPGDYIVRIPASQFAAGAALEDLVSSTGTNGSATGPYEPAPDSDGVEVDNDDNGTSQGSGAVQSLPITLALNDEPDTAVDGDDTYGNLTVDFGFFEPASLGDFVWEDTTLNGIQDTGAETGVANVMVTLHDAITNTVIATTITDANGAYLFDHLIPGSYYVIFSNLPTGYGFVPADQGGNDTLDSDANVITGRTGDYSLVAGQHEPSVDAGITQTNLLRLGNLVWADYNDNGITDGGEPGLAGVTVELLDGTGATVLATTTTDANGNYLFNNLNPGDYVVRIPSSQFGAGAVLENSSSSSGGGTYEPAPDPDTNTSDNRDNGSLTGGAVQSQPITLSLLGEPDVAVDGDDTNGNLTVDFGFVPQLASLGNYVWYDSIRNNIQDTGELGVPNVTVRLLDSTGTQIATTTTDTNGLYLFDNLVPGIYSVVFDRPTGHSFVSQDVGGDDTLDSDANPTTGATIQTTLTAGENDLMWDAGIYESASIGDRVWYDSNNNGIQDSGETGIPNVTVRLLDNSGTVISTTTTDGSGNYLFDGLEPGDYAIEFVPPPGYTFTSQDSGSDDTTDSDADTSTGRTIVTTLSPGEHDPSWDAGVVGIMSLGNLVWNDINNNGLVDTGEMGISGVTVRLLNNSGTVLETSTTDANGNYLFSNLIPGDYMVEIVPPTGYVTSTGSNGSATGPYEAAPDPDNDTNNDDNGTLTGAVIRSGVMSLVANSEPTNDGDSDANSNLTVDFCLYQPASLGNYVWHDENENGIQDSSESGVPGVTVTLYDGSGTVIATTTTDSTGAYRFDNLTPGTYSVGFSNLPAELDRFTSPNQGSDDAQDSDADTTTGRTPPVTLAPGEHNPTIDAGIFSSQPTPIQLSAFTAQRSGNGVLLQWTTSLELNTWGFHILRGSSGNVQNATRITSQMILANGGGLSGANYSWLNSPVSATSQYYYWLEVHDTNGSVTRYGPITVQSNSASSYQVFLPSVMR